MYRAVGWRALQLNVDFEDADAVAGVARAGDFQQLDEACGVRVIIDGQDVTEHIRSPEAAAASSKVAAIPAVRTEVTRILRSLAEQGVVMEGRDIGTVVLPDADVKFFTDASLEVRASRRQKDILDQGRSADLDAVKNALGERDTRDSNRKTSPLKPAEDAIVINTDNRTLDDLEAEMMSIIKERL
jgi:cytidylate kinase